MKKLLAILLATFAITAWSKETVTILYSWLPSDPAANFYRRLADESNKIQDKYTFIFDNKAGAGGSIAARAVERDPSLILANSSALFIRPIFFPGESHEIASFKSLMPMCVAPMLITSSKYKSWKEVPTDQPLSIGISGLGTTTHLVATQIVAKYPNIQIIPFKGTSEALVSVMSGHTDFAVSFMGETVGFVKPTPQTQGRQVYLLGTTGKTNIGGAAPLASQGFPTALAGMSSPQQLFVNRKFPDDKFKEIRAIFVKAANTQSVKDTNGIDHCIPNSQLADAELADWFNSQLVNWRRVATPVAAKQTK